MTTLEELDAKIYSGKTFKQTLHNNKAGVVVWKSHKNLQYADDTVILEMKIEDLQYLIER